MMMLRGSVRPDGQSWARLRLTMDESGVAEVVLDRPPANAIDLLTLAELKQVAEVLSLEKAVRAVILRSALRTIFAAGFDLEMLGQGWGDMLPMIRAFHEAANTWVRIPSPTIAVIGGHAAGGAANWLWRVTFASWPGAGRRSAFPR